MEINTVKFTHKIDIDSLLESNQDIKNEFLSRKKHIQKGEYIYLPDEMSDKIYFLLEGKVKVGYYRDTDKEVITGLLEKGDVFSEFSILGEQKRKDFAITVIDSVLVAFSQHDLQNLMKGHAALSVWMLKIMGDRMAEMENRLASSESCFCMPFSVRCSTPSLQSARFTTSLR